MNFVDRLLSALPWAIATLFAAGVVHIVSILLMPHLAPRDAFARLSMAAQGAVVANGVALLPKPKPGAEAMPFDDPFMVEGVCFFDLSKRLLRLRASVDGEDFLGVSFHTRTGRVFHAVTDRSSIKGKIDIVVGDADQIETLENEDEAAPSEEVRVTSPAKEGFVLIRSLAKRPSDRRRAEQLARAVSCETLPVPES